MQPARQQHPAADLKIVGFFCCKSHLVRFGVGIYVHHVLFSPRVLKGFFRLAICFGKFQLDLLDHVLCLSDVKVYQTGHLS